MRSVVLIDASSPGQMKVSLPSVLHVVHITQVEAGCTLARLGRLELGQTVMVLARSVEHPPLYPPTSINNSVSLSLLSFCFLHISISH